MKPLWCFMSLNFRRTASSSPMGSISIGFFGEHSKSIGFGTSAASIQGFALSFWINQRLELTRYASAKTRR